jgi:hypothetical protein
MLLGLFALSGERFDAVAPAGPAGAHAHTIETELGTANQSLFWNPLVA